MVIDLNSTVVCAAATQDIAASTTAPATRAQALRIIVAQSSGDQFVGDLGRAVALDHGLRLGIVGVLQHRPWGGASAADDDRPRGGGAALPGVNGAGRHKFALALRPSRDRGEPHLGVAGPAAVVDALVTLEALRSIEHAVEHPGVG